MFSEQLLNAVEETTVEFIKGVRRLTAPLTRNGQGYRSVPLEIGTQLGRGGAWTISLQDKLMGIFPELESPGHVRLALETISLLPGAKIGIGVARRWKTDDNGRRVPGEVRTSRDGRSIRHEVFLRTERTGGLDPTDESLAPVEPPLPVDPTEQQPTKSSDGESLDL